MPGETPEQLEVTVADLVGRQRDGGAFVVDVREPWEYEAAHVPGARLMPLGTVPDHLEELRGSAAPVHLVCATGGRSLRAAQWLEGHGVASVSVAGGTAAWRAAGHPVVTGPDAGGTEGSR